MNKTLPEFFDENDDGIKRLADEWENAAAFAGVKLVVSHAPGLHNPCFGVLNNPDDEEYARNIRALRRSIEICHILGIERIVVHACACGEFTDVYVRIYRR